ncbi:MAG: aspartate kinase [Clostridia bacterium]
MDTIVLKFGGSSVSDNVKLNLVAEKIIDLYQEKKCNIAVVVSAQGKTTDMLLKEAKELSAVPKERELDVLLSTGEQITISKLAILLNRMGYKAISLTGWQAGIYTNAIHQSSKVDCIDTTRIEEEFKKGNIVVVAGFQGIDQQGDITTLGRGGSDTTAVALAAALNAKHCYIFSDVDGIYTTDPNRVTVAKKLHELSFDEMQDIADNGARVLHNRCIEIGKKFNSPIVAKSTFNNEEGTVICKQIEGTEIKSIVKNDNLSIVNLYYQNEGKDIFYEIYTTILNQNIKIEKATHDNKNLSMQFIIKNENLNKIQNIIDGYNNIKMQVNEISKIVIVGYGITNEPDILNKTLEIIKHFNIQVLQLNTTQSMIEILLNIKAEDILLESLHKKLIN